MKTTHDSTVAATFEAWFLEGNARWLCPDALHGMVNQYVEFAQEFDVGAAVEGGELLLAADSAYAVWVNGAFVDCGRFPDVPPRRHYDRIDIGPSLRPGRNSLTVGLHVQGVASFQHLPGTPGVAYAVRVGDVRIASGRGARWRTSPHYRSGDLPRVTSQLGFTFEHDASAVRPARWRVLRDTELLETAGRMPLVRRPLPKSVVGEALPATVVAQGVLGPEVRGASSVAEAMQRDLLTARSLADLFGPSAVPGLPSVEGLRVADAHLREGGIYVVLDLGREEAGLLTLNVDTDAGVRIDLGHGEHLQDLRVRTHVGGRNFANRYVCRAGRQEFTHCFHRIAGRYVALHVRGLRTRFRLYHAGVRPVVFPAEERGTFGAADSRLVDIHRTGVRTLRLCMHEHYEDCPWREQALYANDARNQALSGYYAFGDGRFPAASLRLLAEGLGADGWLEMCMPARIGITIPSFTFAWILAVRDHWRYLGDRTFVRRALPTIRSILGAREAALREGLLPCPTGSRYWQFYDWAPGLDGGRRLDAGELRFDAPLNMLLALALQAGAELAGAAGARRDAARWTTLATDLSGAIHARFWDAPAAAYATHTGGRDGDRVAELVQSLGLLCEAVPGSARRRALRQGLAAADRGWTPTTLSQSLYKAEALLAGTKDDGVAALDAVRRDWSAMLDAGATAFWEMHGGQAEFGGAGSLCHGWSAIPVYLYGAYLLGIRPVEPGFAAFSVRPVVPPSLAHARGRVPTPHGDIVVHWEQAAGRTRCRVVHPAACRHALSRVPGMSVAAEVASAPE